MPHGRTCPASAQGVHMYWNKTIETLSPADLAELQLKRLKTTLAQVMKVGFYQKKFKDEGVRPEEVKTLADVSKLPFTRKRT